VRVSGVTIVKEWPLPGPRTGRFLTLKESFEGGPEEILILDIHVQITRSVDHDCHGPTELIEVERRRSLAV
jgi:hypothetical protein